MSSHPRVNRLQSTDLVNSDTGLHTAPKIIRAFAKSVERIQQTPFPENLPRAIEFFIHCQLPGVFALSFE